MKKLITMQLSLLAFISVTLIGLNAFAQRSTYQVEDMVGETNGFSYSLVASRTISCRASIASYSDVYNPRILEHLFEGPDGAEYGFDMRNYANKELTPECMELIKEKFDNDFPRNFPWRSRYFYVQINDSETTTKLDRIDQTAVRCVEDLVDELREVTRDDKRAYVLNRLTSGEVLFNLEIYDSNLKRNLAIEVPSSTPDSDVLEIKFYIEKGRYTYCRLPNMNGFEDDLKEVYKVFTGSN